MTQVAIRNIDDEAMRRLKARAARRGVSLEDVEAVVDGDAGEVDALRTGVVTQRLGDEGAARAADVEPAAPRDVVAEVATGADRARRRGGRVSDIGQRRQPHD